jgi:hypothetical protein
MTFSLPRHFIDCFPPRYSLSPNSLRGFLSIDIDVSELYINQCDNQFHGETHYSNFRNNKASASQDQQHPPPTAHFFAHQIIPLHSSTAYNEDHEIEAFRGSHKCHQDSMDVSKLDLIGTQ